jgi:hypothetical protein
MYNKSLHSLIIVVLLLLSSACFSQTINLGILTSFEAYTGSGDVTNSAGTVTGDVGSNVGVANGFVPPYTGNTYSNNAATKQAQFDLLRLYIHYTARQMPNRVAVPADRFDPTFASVYRVN